MDGTVSTGRRLNQDVLRLAFVQSDPSYFGLTPSEGILEIGAWFMNPAFTIRCKGGTLVGPENPDVCVDLVKVNMSSSLVGTQIITFDLAQLSAMQNTQVDNPDAYVYGLPLNMFAPPNTLYENTEIQFFFSDNVTSTATLADKIFNYYNASASSLREYYGVDSNVRGTEDLVQGSTLFFGTANSAVNTTAVNEYLALQNLVPNIPLEISDWSVENDVSVCGEDLLCIETMLDVQTQQAFAPEAVTFFTPSEIPMERLVSLINPVLEDAGYTAKEIKEISNATYYHFFLDPDDEGWESLDESIQRDLTNLYEDYLREYFLEYMNNVTSSSERVQVVSLSWNSDEYTKIGFDLIEEALKNLTLSGVTIMVSSGDLGASGNQQGNSKDTYCLPSDNPLVMNSTAAWPIVSPWVTVVGGTQFLATQEHPQGIEVVASSVTNGGITSGGGFAGPSFPSHLYSTPAWQRRYVERYLSENNASTFDGFPTEDTPGFNPNGRSVPDISMYGAYFPMLDVRGVDSPQAGTSLSAPMAAAMFTLINQKLLADGYDIIGYANPMIYWMGENCTEAFNDITIGNNMADKNDNTCLYGFPAAPSWDPATGFGSIRFNSFVNCAKRYQDEVRSKGLEILPDGSLNTAVASSGQDGSRPSSSVGRFSVLCSTMVVAAIAMAL